MPSNSKNIPSIVDDDPPNSDKVGADTVPVQLGFGKSDNRQFLARTSSGKITIASQASLANLAWNIIPLSNGLARIECMDSLGWFGLGCNTVNQGVGLVPVAGGSNLVWRVHPFPHNSGSYCFESILYPGYALTYINQGIALSPIDYSFHQQWWPSPPPIAYPQPRIRSVSKEVIPNPPLPPANVHLQNDHNDAVVVLVADIRNGGTFQKIDIEAGQSKLVRLDRDSGSTILETIEVRDNNGDWDQRQFTSTIPPVALYDLSVYELFIQSIAIDRTGTSPNPIEDINYNPRSIGLFWIPPGDRLPEESTILVYSEAAGAKNPGAVRRLSEEDFSSGNSGGDDPLKAILQQVQRKQGVF